MNPHIEETLLEHHFLLFEQGFFIDTCNTDRALPESMRGCNVRVILVASEVVGFAKTGGLADVVGSLPTALAARGHDVAVVMPYYQAVRLGTTRSMSIGQPFRVPLGHRWIECQLHRSTLPDCDVPIIFIDARNTSIVTMRNRAWACINR